MQSPRKNGHDGKTNVPPIPWRLLGTGLELGVLIGGLTYLGHLGDQRWGTGPWLTLTGALVSMVGGVYNLSKEVLKTSNDFGSRAKRKPPEKHQP